MKYSIDEIMEMLVYRFEADDIKVHEQGIRAASEVKNLMCFMQPMYGNPVYTTWDDCAEIVSARSDEELRPYIINMLIWIYDLNKCGALTIFDRLVKYKDKKHLEDCILRMVNYNMKESMKEQLNELIKRASLNVAI